MSDRVADFFDRILGSRFWALFLKEVSQILHNRQLLIQLLLPPTLMLSLFGFALNPNFENLRVGITDYSHSRASREFIELFNQTTAFNIRKYYANEQDMQADLETGKLTVGVTIPPEFDDDLARKRPTQVQALFDAVDANTASVASGYLNQLVSDYNLRRSDRNQRRQGTSSSLNSAPTNPDLQPNQIQLQTTVFYNPGLKGSWFIVPGTIGIVLTVVGSQAAASLVVREKEAGTIEQLIMTPASNTEVIFAKIAPLLVLLTLDAVIALLVGKIAFDLPFRGNLLVFLGISILYFLVGISIGIMIASYAKSEQQAQLTTFFVNPPLVLLSGGNSPTSAMPPFMQWLSYLDPMRYFIEVCRGVLLKGVGLEVLWSQVLILLMFAIVLMTLSIRQFRRQLM
ncbi:ABC transporter permease [Leptolyngbya sp. FACHB-36]|nr:ABC transporter permease [Leptolyngbya sp. FACHB-36]